MILVGQFLDFRQDAVTFWRKRMRKPGLDSSSGKFVCLPGWLFLMKKVKR